MTIVLFENQNTNATGTGSASSGFQGTLFIGGNLDSGNVTIQVSAEGQSGTYVEIRDGAGVAINNFTVVGMISQFSIPVGYFVRAVLAGAGGSVDVTVKLI